MKPRSSSSTRKGGHSLTSKVIFSALTILITSGCVVSSEDYPNTESTEFSPQKPSLESSPSGKDSLENPQVIASSTTTSTELGNELQIDIYALERLENNLLRLRLGITNKSDKNYRLYRGLGQEGDEYTASAVSLIDSNNRKRYLSLDQSDGKCFCLPLEGNLDSGETGGVWVIYPAPPKEVESMTIVTPLSPPILDVPITSSSEILENSGLADPEILDLTVISDSIEDNTGRTESNEEISIILSSDVLFKTNSSELSSEAQKILEQVATEINGAGSSTVNIDGYADNTGNDSVNLPLSQDRAEEVESVLKELVTRRGVIFEVEGHGSRDPIASNETEEGRERNRRVSVTFEK